MRHLAIKAAETWWGDYSAILANGMCSRGRSDGVIQLERTGPFVPPVTFPGIYEVVVTDAFRAALDSSGLSGFSFQPLVKAHIAASNWETWPGDADEPREYPESGVPEDCILAVPHDEETSPTPGCALPAAPARKAVRPRPSR